MNKTLLTEGGAAGHMAHPFDLDWVQNGTDLLNFFSEKVPSYLQNNEPHIKTDGINVSFKLVKGQNTGKLEFAVDRGSKKPIDVEGVTIDRIGERFAEGHGMRPAIESLLTIFNSALDSGAISEELTMLGMDEDPNLFFNTEYVLEEEGKIGEKKPINVVLYNENFIAIHGLNQFYEKASPKGRSVSRASREIRLNAKKQAALQSLISKVRRFSQNYNVYGPEDTKASLKNAEINLDRVLSEEITIFTTENNPVTNTLGGWLRNPKVTNPFDAKYKTPLHPKGVAGALSKFTYTTLLPDEGDPTPVSTLLGVDDVEQATIAINGAIFYHATRLLGREVLRSLTASFGSSDVSEHEGIVLRSEELFEYTGPVKITGDFIVSGMTGSISDKMKTDEPAREEPTIKRRIAVIPGKFKPPHRGHMDMVEHYAKVADYVLILISPLPKITEKGIKIDKDKSESIWREYSRAKGLQGKVFIGESPFNSPVKSAYEVLAGNIPDFMPQAGDMIIPGASTKPDPDTGVSDIERFARFANGIKGQIEGVMAADVADYAFTPSGEVLNARDFRDALDSGDDIAKWIPQGADEDKIFAILGIRKAPEEVPMIAETIFGIIGEVLSEKEEIQRKWRQKHAKNRLTTKGPVKKEAPYEGDPPHERSESAPPVVEEEELDEETGSAGCEGPAGGFVGLEDEEDRKDLTIRRAKPTEPSLIREKDKIVEEIMDYLLKKMA